MYDREIKVYDRGIQVYDWGIQVFNWGIQVYDWGIQVFDRGVQVYYWGIQEYDWGILLFESQLETVLNSQVFFSDDLPVYVVLIIKSPKSIPNIKNFTLQVLPLWSIRL